MSPSTSVGLNGLLLDTNVLSLLAVANKLTLLQERATMPLYITPRIVEELHIGLSKGVLALGNVLALINTGQIQVLQLTSIEKVRQARLPPKLGQGEAEAIAICRQRNMIFITHDRKAANYCLRESIGCIRLTDFLNQLLLAGLLSQMELDAILA